VNRIVSLEEFKGGREKEKLTPKSIEALKRQGFVIEELR
jgi:hypothetical protein